MGLPFRVFNKPYGLWQGSKRGNTLVLAGGLCIAFYPEEMVIRNLAVGTCLVKQPVKKNYIHPCKYLFLPFERKGGCKPVNFNFKQTKGGPMYESLIPIAMADDHVMIRQALAGLVESFGYYKVIIQASNGKDLLQKLMPGNLPALVLLDISMPEMGGMETAKIISAQYPEIKILALTMMDDERSVVGMVRNGAKGYIVKDAEPAALKEAMANVLEKGFHYSDLVTGRLVHTLQTGEGPHDPKGIHLTDRERAFLKYACTELTYKEIADRMYVSPRTVDGYRDGLFEKLGVKSRVGLCLYSIKAGIYTT